MNLVHSTVSKVNSNAHGDRARILQTGVKSIGVELMVFIRPNSQ